MTLRSGVVFVIASTPLTSGSSGMWLLKICAEPGTWLLWFAPGVLVVIGAFVIANILRKRTRQPVAVVSSEEDW